MRIIEEGLFHYKTSSEALIMNDKFILFLFALKNNGICFNLVNNDFFFFFFLSSLKRKDNLFIHFLSINHTIINLPDFVGDLF